MTTPVLAHHPIGGVTPTTLWHGLLSGLGHPVIGPDHLAFIIAIGLAAALVPAGVGLIAAFIAASTAGVLVHLGAFNLALSEILVAGSVVVAGLLVALGRHSGSGPWLLLALFAGVMHGYAFGEAVVGADRAVVGAYLVGLALVSALVAVGVMLVAARFSRSSDRAPRYAVVAGSALSCVGVAMLAVTMLAA